MKLQKNQSGSAHLLIIILLLVALLGSLGFIFWQNFMKADETNKQSTEKTVKPSEESSDSLTISLGNYLAKKFVLTYPKTWTLGANESASADSGLIENVRITSPSKNVYVDYVSYFDNSSGYVCGNDVESHTYESFTPTRLTGFPEFSYYEATVNSKNNGYFYTAYLSQNNTLKDAPNANYCSLDTYNIYTRESIPTGGDQSPRIFWTAKIGSSVYMTASNEIKKYAATISELNEFLASDDFKAAKSILISAKTE